METGEEETSLAEGETAAMKIPEDSRTGAKARVKMIPELGEARARTKKEAQEEYESQRKGDHDDFNT